MKEKYVIKVLDSLAYFKSYDRNNGITWGNLDQTQKFNKEVDAEFIIRTYPDFRHWVVEVKKIYCI